MNYEQFMNASLGSGQGAGKAPYAEISAFPP